MDNTQGGYVYLVGATVTDVEFAVGDYTFKVNAADFSLDAESSEFLFGGN